MRSHFSLSGVVKHAGTENMLKRFPPRALKRLHKDDSLLYARLNYGGTSGGTL